MSASESVGVRIRLFSLATLKNVCAFDVSVGAGKRWCLMLLAADGAP
jgi:hypothetical protein